MNDDLIFGNDVFTNEKRFNILSLIASELDDVLIIFIHGNISTTVKLFLKGSTKFLEIEIGGQSFD